MSEQESIDEAVEARYQRLLDFVRLWRKARTIPEVEHAVGVNRGKAVDEVFWGMKSIASSTDVNVSRYYAQTRDLLESMSVGTIDVLAHTLSTHSTHKEGREILHIYRGFRDHDRRGHPIAKPTPTETTMTTADKPDVRSVDLDPKYAPLVELLRMMLAPTTNTAAFALYLPDEKYTRVASILRDMVKDPIGNAATSYALLHDLLESLSESEVSDVIEHLQPSYRKEWFARIYGQFRDGTRDGCTLAPAPAPKKPSWPEMARLLVGDRAPEWCSFCMEHVEKKDLVVAPNTRICRRCIALAKEILNERTST